MSFASLLGGYKTAAKPRKRSAEERDAPAKRPTPAPAPAPRVAVMCMARDEATFIPIWLNYYSAQGFAPEDIYVLDHMTRDGSLDDPVNVSRSRDDAMHPCGAADSEGNLWVAWYAWEKMGFENNENKEEKNGNTSCDESTYLAYYRSNEVSGRTSRAYT